MAGDEVVADDVLRGAIRDHALDAAAALAVIQIGRPDPPLTAASLQAAADLLGRTDIEDLWLETLEDRGLRAAFVGALEARGVQLPRAGGPGGPGGGGGGGGNVPLDGLIEFLPRARSFRCRVKLDGEFKGSGVLVGPSLVLTAWHVIAVAAPGSPQEPVPRLEVVLEDDTVHRARVPAALESWCTDEEFVATVPSVDAAFAGRNDMALLAMDRPAAVHLGHATVRDPAPSPNGEVVVVHFPAGADDVVGWGSATPMPGVTARWCHSVGTEPGSSGAPCFNGAYELIGIHQGAFGAGGRFVPLSRFLDDRFLGLVAEDTAPTGLWSLDGTVAGPLVIGRSELFRAVAAAGRGGRVRGVRIKRARPDKGPAGLGFSHDILRQLLARRGPEHVLVRITQDEAIADLVVEIAQRVTAAGVDVASPPPPVTGPGSPPPETVAKERAVALVDAIEAAAAASARTVWCFFDHPAVAVPESARLVLEGFVGAALDRPHLGLVIAGSEDLALPGVEFRSPPLPGEGPPGLVVEVLGGFRRADVLDLVASIGSVGPDVAAFITDKALEGLDHLNGVYGDELLAAVVERLRGLLPSPEEEP